ncbi:nuclear transport factor 2 family protein [Tenacibaculum agarivorans]|uniref:nuclear transport factor 2 family protein n=1 Tax=Tenacibaculum agarivorans TaxID=1908389 RepID=UPI00094B9D31|nr:nuclear transport factor 2 family protein [Tenacibaculum agarivorans]
MILSNEIVGNFKNYTIRKITFILLSIIFFSCNEKRSTESKIDLPIDIGQEKAKLRFLKEVEWPKAYKEQDTILLDRILGEDFQMITNNGEWSNKAKQLERIKKFAMNHDSFRYEIKRLEILQNNTAIIAGTGHIINDNKKSIYQSSNVLMKRNGVWKAVLSHVSGYTELE